MSKIRFKVQISRFAYVRTDSEGFATYSYQRSYNGQVVVRFIPAHFHPSNLTHFHHSNWDFSTPQIWHMSSPHLNFSVWEKDMKWNLAEPPVLPPLLWRGSLLQWFLGGEWSWDWLCWDHWQGFHLQLREWLLSRGTSYITIWTKDGWVQTISGNLQLLVRLAEWRLGLQHWHLLADLLILILA